MLIGASEFLYIVNSYRVVWLRGRVGGLKTSLALRIAIELMNKNPQYRLVTNTSCVLADDMDAIKLQPDNMAHLIILADEGGRQFQQRGLVEAMMTYPRKMDLVLLIPSFWSPHRSAQVVSVWADRSARAMGIPYVRFRWEARQGREINGGHFHWIWPSEVWGLYSTQDPGDTIQEIFSALLELAGEYEKTFKRKAKTHLSTRTIDLSEMATEGGAVNDLSDVADEIETQTDRLATLLERATKHGRRRKR